MSSNLHGNFALLSWWSTVLLITLGKCSAINSFTYERDVTSATSEPLVQLAINANKTATVTLSQDATWSPVASQRKDGRQVTGIPPKTTIALSDADKATATSSEISSLSSLPFSSPYPDTETPIRTLDDYEAQFDGVHEYIGSSGPNERESDAILKALDWLTEKRLSNYGWGNDTPLVILAKELSGAHDLTDSADAHIEVIQDLEDQLSAKQMAIDIFSLLEHHHHSVTPKTINVGQLALYSLALSSLCKNPKHFMDQHDLISMIQHHETLEDETFALAALAVCSAGEHVRKRQIRKLISIALETNGQNIETAALVILAMRCIMTDRHHRHMEHFIRRPAIRLAMLQGYQGDFGTLKGTALAMEALQELSIIPASIWSRSAATKWLLERQRDDGGWTEEPLTDGQDPSIGVGLTAHIMLALGRKGLGAIRMLECNNILSESNVHRLEPTIQKLASPVALTPSAPSDVNINIETVSYTYTIWISSKGKAIDSVSLALTSPRNTTFYQAMAQAADIDSRFAFDAHDWPNGHYIHTLAGREEEPSKFNYWLLYRLPEMPDANNTPGNQYINSLGVDETIVENNQHYLYWYKKL